MANLDRGLDRRILSSSKLHLQRLVQRDQMARNPKPTRKISTRMLVFDPADTALANSLNLVLEHLDARLQVTDT